MPILKRFLFGFFVFVFFSLFYFIFAPKAYAANWYVDNAATGTNSGTSWTDAWTGLAAIVWTSVNPGDTVFISGGTTSKTYVESIIYTRSGTSGSPITIDIGVNSPFPSGHNGVVIIDGSAGYCIRANGDYNYLKNLTCQNAIASGFRIQGAGTIIENSTVGNSYQQGIEVHFCTGCIVRGNRITTSDDIAQQTDGIAVYDSSDTIVEKNWVKITNQNDCVSCHQDGIQASFTAASIYTNITIRYNYVENTKASASNAQGIYVTLMQGDVKIYGNVVSVPIGGQAVASRLANTLPVTVSVIGNIIKNGGYWALRVEDDNPVIKNNIIWQTGGNVGYVQNGALVRLDGLSSNDPTNVNYNLYYAPYTDASTFSFYISSTSKSWDTWRTTYSLDANSSLAQTSTLDSCLRPAGSSPPVDSAATLGAEYGSGLSMSLCGPNGVDSFLPVSLVDRSVSGGTAWDIGAYELLPLTVTIDQKSDQPDPVNSYPVNFTAVFSESVTGFDGGDVTLSGTAGATTATVTGSGTTYTIAVSGMSTTGTVIASIAAGKATGIYGDTNAASTSTDNVVLYRPSSIASPGSSSSWCSNVVGPGSPDLFEIHTARTTADLYFAPPSMPYSSIYILYSERSDSWMYGVEYPQGFSGGVLQYTIRALKPNTTYYFSLRSGNGCATGAWGNTLSAKTTSFIKTIRKAYRVH